MASKLDLCVIRANSPKLAKYVEVQLLKTLLQGETGKLLWSSVGLLIVIAIIPIIKIIMIIVVVVVVVVVLVVVVVVVVIIVTASHY